MGDLISRSALIEEIKNLQVFVTGLRAGKGILNEYEKQYRETILRIIDEQPTAYDVSKVVAELEGASKAMMPVIPTKDAISIVKAGGVE